MSDSLFTLRKDVPTEKQRAGMIKELCWRSYQAGANRERPFKSDEEQDAWEKVRKAKFDNFWYTQIDPNRIHT